jgi:osmoprotectant transport system permease protein
VAAAGALVALAGSLVLPLVEFRANRIVAGTPHPFAIGGPAAFVLVALAVAALCVALAVPRERRAVLELACAGAMAAALAFALGTATSDLTAVASPITRVSIGAGAWVAALGIAILAFAGAQGRVPALARAVAGSLAAAAWLGVALWGGLAKLSIVLEYRAQAALFWSAVGTHMSLVGVSVCLALVIGVPLGVAASRVEWVRVPVLGAVGVIQTVPSLALLGLLVVPLSLMGLPGIGPLPAVIALTLYSLLPVVRDTYVGLSGIDPAVVDAGRGMGMSSSQLLLRVEAPLALPLLVEGVRAATVSIIGIAAVVAFVGVGTLGRLVFEGWGYQADDLILLGAIPMVVMAVAADAALRRLGRAVTSPGIRGG